MKLGATTRQVTDLIVRYLIFPSLGIIGFNNKGYATSVATQGLGLEGLGLLVLKIMISVLWGVYRALCETQGKLQHIKLSTVIKQSFYVLLAHSIILIIEILACVICLGPSFDDFINNLAKIGRNPVITFTVVGILGVVYRALPKTCNNLDQLPVVWVILLFVLSGWYNLNFTFICTCPQIQFVWHIFSKHNKFAGICAMQLELALLILTSMQWSITMHSGQALKKQLVRFYQSRKGQ